MTPEQALIDSALRSWRSNMDRAGKFFGSLTSDELELEVAPTRNRLVYIWGHRIAFNEGILPLFEFGPRRHPELDRLFVSRPDRAVSQILNGPDLNNIWTQLDAALRAEFQKLSPSEGCGGI